MRLLTWAAPLAAGALVLAAPAVGSPVGCGALGGAIDNGSCHVSVSQPGYTLELKFPLDYPDTAAIIGYLTQTRDGFVNVASDESRSRPYQLDVTAESFQSARTRSVVLTLFQDVGGAHPSTWYKSFTYDLEWARPVTFETLFAPDADALEMIAPIVQRKLEADTGLAGSISAQDALNPVHYQNFAVTDDAVIFYFARAELLPSYAGAASVSVPRDQIPPLRL